MRCSWSNTHCPGTFNLAGSFSAGTSTFTRAGITYRYWASIPDAYGDVGNGLSDYMCIGQTVYGDWP